MTVGYIGIGGHIDEFVGEIIVEYEAHPEGTKGIQKFKQEYQWYVRWKEEETVDCVHGAAAAAAGGGGGGGGGGDGDGGRRIVPRHC